MLLLLETGFCSALCLLQGTWVLLGDRLAFLILQRATGLLIFLSLCALVGFKVKP